MGNLMDQEFIKDKLIKFYNCKILRDHQLKDDYLYVLNGKIINPELYFYRKKKKEDISIDCEGCIISPGFIDIQLNGSVGYDFSASHQINEETVATISKAQLLLGVTSYCPTIVSSRPEVYSKVVPLLGPKKGSIENGAEVLGAHLEGPFISPFKKGAHEKETLRDAKNGLSDIYACYGEENLKKHTAYITVAPEVKGIVDCIQPLIKETGIQVSQGHSQANVDEAENARTLGCRLVTHLFNAMAAFHQRDPGIVGLLGSADDRTYYGIICDGHHVHPNSVKIAYYAHPKGAVLVTDAMTAQCLKEGNYTLGKLDVEMRNGFVYVKGTNTIAGSVVTMSECVKNFIKFTGASVVEALEAATLHPAKFLNIESRKGTLDFDADADFLFLDNELNIKKIFIAGVEATSENVHVTPNI